MLGLDGAGKTQLLYQLQAQNQIISQPTTRVNVQTIHLQNNSSISVWDMGGHPQLRVLWFYYLQNTQIVIYVVDSADRDPNRIQQSKNELERLLNHQELENIPFIILFNKTDLPQAMNIEEIQEKFNITIGSKQTVTSHKIIATQITAISNTCVKEEVIKLLEKVIFE
ncbi:ADP-ribosylation_factor [Hexamita inflata]|uniref:ADP-ribosylation factor n=1 Tax=Hexamita inflata TaxID=28002 RepID=A0AA86NVM9_9EUKA|nr:ADP-ribosylation factor [Hexamita inflata]CAI9962605.1 ADP-ribosylation factor [Hexamita inflata]